MKKGLLFSFAAILMVISFISVPKAASAYVYEVYQYSVDQNGCNRMFRVTYNVDIWNQVTEVGRVFVGYTNCPPPPVE